MTTLAGVRENFQRMEVRIVRLLGGGSFGRVFEAVTSDNHRVAVKLLAGASDFHVKGFYREIFHLSYESPPVTTLSTRG
jgi:serine/threonine protein kinase